MQDSFLNHKQKESRERWWKGSMAGQGEERGGHFAEPTMANFMQTKTEGDSSRWSRSLTGDGGHEGGRARVAVWNSIFRKGNASSVFGSAAVRVHSPDADALVS